MIYNCELPIQGTKLIVPLLVEATIEGTVKNIGLKPLFSNPDLIKVLSLTGDKLFIDSVEGFDLPLVTCNSGKTCNPLYTLFLKNIDSELSDDNFQAVSNKLNGVPTKEQLKIIFESIKFLNVYLKGELEFKIDFPRENILNMTRTSSLIDLQNDKGVLHLSFDKPEINKTEFMRTPKDRAFIRIPSYEELYNESYRFPDRNQVFNPYRKIEFNFVNFKQYLTKDDDITAIIGNSENNDLPIQDNELEFYNALVELMNYGIQQEYPDKTLEECVSAGISSNVVKNYILELCSLFANWNWFHTGYIPSEKFGAPEEDLDNAESEDEQGDGLSTGLGFQEVHDISEQNLNGEQFIKDYLYETTTDIYSICEAAVKLLRWGERKPTRLKVSNSKTYLDLNTFKFESNSGSLKDLKPILHNGKCMKLVGMVLAEGKFKDTKYLYSLGYRESSLNLPVAFMTEKSYENGFKQTIFVAISDYFELVKECPGIDGIDIVDGRFVLQNNELPTISLEKAIQYCNTSTDAKVIVYQTEKFKNFFMEYNCSIKRSSIVHILGRFVDIGNVESLLVTQTFEDKSELISKIEEYRLPVDSFIEANIANSILPLYLNVAHKNNEYRINKFAPATMIEMLNMYIDSFKNLNFDNDYIKIGKDESFISSTSQSIENKITRLSAFETQDTKKEEQSNEVVKTTEVLESTSDNVKPITIEEDEEAVISDTKSSDVEKIFYKIQNPIKVSKLYDMADSGRIDIGWVLFFEENGETRYVFAGNHVTFNKPAGQEKVTGVKITSVVKIMVDCLLFLALGKPEQSKGRFYDIKSLEDIRNYLADRKLT